MDPVETRPAAVLSVRYEGWSQRVELRDAPVIVGRGEGCDVRIADARLSRQHCRFFLKDGGWHVEDLGSQAGTYVEGVVLDRPRRVVEGEEIAAGPLTARLASTDGGTILSGDHARDARNVDTLLSAVGDLTRVEEHDELLRAIVDRAVKLAGGDRGALLLETEGGSGTMETAVARDADGRDLEPDQALTRSLPMQALAANRAVLLTDAAAPSQREQVSTSIVREALRSVLCVPLPGEGRPMGVLYVDGRRAAGEVGPAELRVLEALAIHGALALEMAAARRERARRGHEARARLAGENEELRARLGSDLPVAESPAMCQALETLRRVASADATVLLTGETGTGKEVLARYLHRHGSRGAGPFVVVDCGALPEGLIESELFGHEKGAFTGAASARPGRFREAHGGTLFLDEIAELPLPLQTRLLRVLQEKTVQPVGGSGRTEVDVRVVCATHRDLQARVKDGTFREDLYYRAAVVSVPVPPLRQRGGDVELLARHFLTRFAAAYGTALQDFTREALQALLAHAWPGNVRELENRVQRAVLLAHPPWVKRSDLGLAGGAPSGDDRGPAAPPEEAIPLLALQEARAEATERFERAYVEEALQRTGGNVTHAAALAGVSPQLFRRLIKKHDIDRRRFSE